MATKPPTTVRIEYVCSSCMDVQTKWFGQCRACSKWGSYEQREVNGGGGGPPPLSRRAGWLNNRTAQDQKPRAITDIDASENARIPTRIGELDRVLGGNEKKEGLGIVPGSLVMVGGEPGVGKSSLLTLAAHNIAMSHGMVLYCSGEESPQQIRMRADRMGCIHPSLFLAPETGVERITELLEKMTPKLIVVDSIQSATSDESSGGAGSPSQMKACGDVLLNLAKATGIPVFLIGHVTKDGAIAGPKMLEHMVDTVLYFEGERTGTYRILRAVKNRFGSTNEIGVFEMSDDGLREVPNPSEALLADRDGSGPGSCVVPLIDGNRPMLVEIQGLCAISKTPSPRRSVLGLPFDRVNMVLACLERRVGIHVSDMDIYTNCAGGVKVQETGADLGIMLAIASSSCGVPCDPDTVAMGEVGLTGEVRPVSQMERRINEAARMGFKRAIVPKRAADLLQSKFDTIVLIGVKSAREAVVASLGDGIYDFLDD